ncbi:hypothetical protein AAG906_024847 [Vitis piasezkii]
MLLYKNSFEQTYYDILSVKEDASYEEIRGCYRSAILNSHPDKLQKTTETSNTDPESGDRFLKIQKAWETLSDPRSRAVYDSGLRASRQDTATAEDLSLEDMTIEDDGKVLELFYQCRCGDYFSVDSSELGEMGYAVFRDGSKISLQTPDSLPASFILPCGSCSLKVRLLINADTAVVVSDNL